MNNLDDELAAARQRCERADRARHEQQEQEQQRETERRRLLEEAVARLTPYGHEVFVQVKPAKWFQRFGCYLSGTNRYVVMSRRRCWVIGTSDADPVLLLEDATLGRFCPQVVLQSKRAGEFVSPNELSSRHRTTEPLERGWPLQPDADGRQSALLAPQIAKAIASYEREHTPL